MHYFTRFLIIVVIQNIAEFFETDGKLVVSFVRSGFLWNLYLLNCISYYAMSVKMNNAPQCGAFVMYSCG